MGCLYQQQKHISLQMQLHFNTELHDNAGMFGHVHKCSTVHEMTFTFTAN